MTEFDRIIQKIPRHERLLGRYLRRLAISIDDALARKGMTQKDLAERSGMKESHLSRLLNHMRNVLGNPRLDTIARLEAALDVQLLGFPQFDAWSAETLSETAVTRPFSLGEDRSAVITVTEKNSSRNVIPLVSDMQKRTHVIGGEPVRPDQPLVA